jgi:hypothetical protein
MIQVGSYQNIYIKENMTQKKPRQYTSYFSFFGYYWGLSMIRDWQALKTWKVFGFIS